MGFFFGGIYFLGLGFGGVSVFVLLSVGSIIVGLLIAGRCVLVIIADAVGLLFVVLCNCGSVLSSMSGAGRGRG